MVNINKKILIVEDDKNFLWILKQSFQTEGFLVLTAENGELGLDIAGREKPDISLLGILMPKMDGITVSKKLKETGNPAQIMFLTNLKDVQHISEAMESVEETDYIVKSDVHVDVVVAMVKDKLGIK